MAEGVDGDGLAGFEADGLAVAAQGDRALADDVGGVGVEIHHHTGVLIDTQDETSVRQFGLEHGEAPLTEIAEARVVVAALGVVVMRDDRNVQADLRQHVEPVQPVRVESDLVDLVHGHGRPAERQCRCRREHDRAAGAQLVGDGAGDGSVAPLLEREGRAAGAGEHPVGRTDLGDAPLDGNRVT